MHMFILNTHVYFDGTYILQVLLQIVLNVYYTMHKPCIHQTRKRDESDKG